MKAKKTHARRRKFADEGKILLGPTPEGKPVFMEWVEAEVTRPKVRWKRLKMITTAIEIKWTQRSDGGAS